MPALSRSDPLPPTSLHSMNEPSYFNVPLRTQTLTPFVSASLSPSKTKYGNSMRHQPSLPSMPENASSAPLPSTNTTPRPIDRHSFPGFNVDPPRPPRDGYE
ncbi:uncharacterized protein FTOL_08941 [Fusarium torulosum]|uniref:Uncharacterized protein n=1 Tax=Fusarium torulosum TaxID=33205 RepID=A0AAE8MDH7_9HYPO|nr:uncharacterized protein FTOL_08941 [Fusarium torulosum]